MQRFSKRFFSLLIAVCMTIAMLPAFEASAAEATDYTEFFGYTQMKTANQQTAYKKMCEAVINMDADGVIFESGFITKEEISNIAMLLPYDLPQAFYFRGPHYLSILTDGSIQFIPIFVTNSEGEFAETEDQLAEVRRQKEALDAKVKQIVAGVPTSVDTDMEKSVYVYDLVVGMAEYKDTVHDQTAYGALIEGECVCAG